VTAASLLPLPDDPRFQELIADWPNYESNPHIIWPRSSWLTSFEAALRPFYPSANAASLKLTARHYAPFPLAAGHDVP